MNYGKKFLYILMTAMGMVIAITGLGFKTGYYEGHSEASAIFIIAVGLFVTIYGLYRLRQYK